MKTKLLIGIFALFQLNADNIEIYWQPVKGAVKYEVTHSTKYITVTQVVISTNLIISGNNDVHYVKVRAVGADNSLSDDSNTITIHRRKKHPKNSLDAPHIDFNIIP